MIPFFLSRKVCRVVLCGLSDYTNPLKYYCILIQIFIFIYMNILYTLLPILLVVFIGYLIYVDTHNKDARR